MPQQKPLSPVPHGHQKHWGNFATKLVGGLSVLVTISMFVNKMRFPEEDINVPSVTDPIRIRGSIYARRQNHCETSPHASINLLVFKTQPLDWLITALYNPPESRWQVNEPRSSSSVSLNCCFSQIWTFSHKVVFHHDRQNQGFDVFISWRCLCLRFQPVDVTKTRCVML